MVCLSYGHPPNDEIIFSNAAKLYLFNLTEKHFWLLNFNEVKTLVKSTDFRKLRNFYEKVTDFLLESYRLPICKSLGCFMEVTCFLVLYI